MSNKGKILRVVSEAGSWNQTDYIRLDGTESEFDIKEIAEQAFFDAANYGYSVIDESEVPEDERDDII